MYARRLDGSVVVDDGSEKLAGCLSLWWCTVAACHAHAVDGCPCGRSELAAAARLRVREAIAEIESDVRALDLTDAEVDAIIAAARGPS